MIYENIEVEMPAKRRVSWSKNKPYVSEIFSRKGKHTEDDVQIVGVAISKDSNMMHPNHIYYQRHPEVELPKQENKEFCACQSIGPIVFIDEICNRTGLKDVLGEVYKENHKEIIAALTCLIGCRELSIDAYKSYQYDHYLGLNYYLDLERLLNSVITHENINEFVEKWLTYRLMLSKKPIVEIDFDSSNCNTYSDGISYAERGNAKVKEGLPQINFSYIVERETGIPIHFDMFYGSVVDMEHCKNYLKKVTHINKKSKAFFCLDRGYYTKECLKMFDNDYKFAMMGKENLQSRKFMKEYPIPVMTKSVNRVKGSIYGVQFEDKPFEDYGKNLYIYLFFDSSKNLRTAMKEQDKLERVAETLIGKKDKNISNTWGKKIDLTINKKTKIITNAVVAYDKLDDQIRETGYFYIVSNEKMTAKEMFSFYRHRDVVEKSFKLSRSEENLGKVYAQSDGAYESRRFLGFLSAIVRTDILSRMQPFFFQYSQETSQSVVNEISKIKSDIHGGKSILMCPLTSFQKQMLSYYSLNHKDFQKVIDEFEVLNFPD